MPQGLLLGCGAKLWLLGRPQPAAFRPTDPAAIRRWLAQINNESFEEREEAVRGLLAVGPEIEAWLEAAPGQHEAEVTAQLARIRHALCLNAIPRKKRGETLNLPGYIAALAADPGGACWIAACQANSETSFYLVWGISLEEGLVLEGEMELPYLPAQLLYGADHRTLLAGFSTGGLAVYLKREGAAGPAFRPRQP